MILRSTAILMLLAYSIGASAAGTAGFRLAPGPGTHRFPFFDAPNGGTLPAGPIHRVRHVRHGAGARMHRFAGQGRGKKGNTVAMNVQSNGFDNYYDVLGIDPKADAEAIRLAYLDRIKQWHPDRNAHRLAEAENMAKVINAAYDTLKDPARRKQYDRMVRFTRGRNFRATVNEQTFEKTFEKAAPMFKQFAGNVRELFSLFTSAVRGEYGLHPVNLGMVGGGLLYFIVPTDLVPDFLPFIGYLDDMAILTMIVNSLQSELAAFRRWKNRETRPGTGDREK